MQGWAAEQDDATFFLSILTIGEYDKGIHNLAKESSQPAAYIEPRDGLIARFEDRIMPISVAVVRRWEVLTGTIAMSSCCASPRFRAQAAMQPLILPQRRLPSRVAKPCRRSTISFPRFASLRPWALHLSSRALPSSSWPSRLQVWLRISRVTFSSPEPSLRRDWVQILRLIWGAPLLASLSSVDFLLSHVRTVR